MSSGYLTVALKLVSAGAFALVVAGCAAVTESERSSGARAGGAEPEALLFERKQKTYDLAFDRVYGAVEAHVSAEGGQVVRGSADELVLEAVLSGDGGSRRRWNVRFELVVEGVTVRVQAYEAGTDIPVEVAEVYAGFFSGVESHL